MLRIFMETIHTMYRLQYRQRTRGKHGKWMGNKTYNGLRFFYDEELINVHHLKIVKKNMTKW